MKDSVFWMNPAINLAAVLICFLGVIYVVTGARVDRKLDRFFLQISVCLILFGGATMARQFLNGRPGEGVHTVMMVSCFLEFLSGCLLAYSASRYLLFEACPNQTWLRRLMVGILTAHIAVLAVTQFNGFYYTIDAANHYSRSSGYLFCYIPTALLMLVDIYILIRWRARLRSREQVAFWIYLGVPALSIILQIAIPGISFGVLASTIAAFCLYLIIVGDRTRRYNEQAQENAKLKNDILLAQIQPHFLYNTLGTIKATCSEDPMRARDAIDQFTEYLRHNMDSLTEKQPIPFSRELTHVQRYLELQQLRFGPDLGVAFDLEGTDFRIPTLTLQPIVENAVTYGVRKNQDGQGQVIIRTREFEDRWEVSVTDDGPGFVPETLPGDRKRSHVGLQNVRDRLQHADGGELRIDSALGEGTTVTIVLPKEGQAE